MVKSGNLSLRLLTSTLAFLVTFGWPEVNSASLEVAQPVHQAVGHKGHAVSQDTDGMSHSIINVAISYNCSNS